MQPKRCLETKVAILIRHERTADCEAELLVIFDAQALGQRMGIIRARRRRRHGADARKFGDRERVPAIGQGPRRPNALRQRRTAGLLPLLNDKRPSNGRFVRAHHRQLGRVAEEARRIGQLHRDFARPGFRAHDRFVWMRCCMRRHCIIHRLHVVAAHEAKDGGGAFNRKRNRLSTFHHVSTECRATITENRHRRVERRLGARVRIPRFGGALYHRVFALRKLKVRQNVEASIDSIPSARMEYVAVSTHGKHAKHVRFNCHRRMAGVRPTLREFLRSSGARFEVRLFRVVVKGSVQDDRRDLRAERRKRASEMHAIKRAFIEEPDHRRTPLCRRHRRGRLWRCRRSLLTERRWRRRSSQQSKEHSPTQCVTHDSSLPKREGDARAVAAGWHRSTA